MVRPQNLTKMLFAALLLIGIQSGESNAQDLPLIGAFAGNGNDFSGAAFPIGGFDGLFNPNTGTADWKTYFGTLSNQTTSFVLVREIYPNVYYYEQSVIFTGGSGFYEEASGAAEFRGFINLATGDYVGWIDGLLTLD